MSKYINTFFKNTKDQFIIGSFSFMMGGIICSSWYISNLHRQLKIQNNELKNLKERIDNIEHRMDKNIYNLENRSNMKLEEVNNNIREIRNYIVHRNVYPHEI